MLSIFLLAKLDGGALALVVMLLILLIAVMIGGIITAVLETREEERKKLVAAEQEHRRQMEAAATESQRLRKEAERQRAAAEQIAQEKQIVLANAQRDIKKQQLLAASLDDGSKLEVIVNQRLLHQARQGRVMNVHFIAVLAGRLVIQWAVTCDGPLVPQVTGFRDGKKIFAEHSFAGEHPDQVHRGVRYIYSFRVQRDGRVIEKEDEFLFEVLIPTPEDWNRPTSVMLPQPPEDPSSRRKRLIAEKGQAVTEQMEAMGQAMRAAEQQLRQQGCDEDTILRTLARLESQLSQKVEE